MRSEFSNDLNDIADKILKIKENKIDLLNLKLKIKESDKMSESPYYGMLLKKITLLLNDNKFDDVISLYQQVKDLNDLHIERSYSKALLGKLEIDKAIQVLKNAMIRYAKQGYIYSDLGNIYLLNNNQKEGIKNLYTSLSMQRDLKFACKDIITLCKIFIEKENYEEARKYLDLYKYIRLKNKWKLENEYNILFQKLKEIPENINFEELEKIMKTKWKNEVLKGQEIVYGTIKSVKDKFGFVCNEKNEEYYFRIKNEKFKVGDKVSFVLEDSFDRKKNEYKKNAINVKIIKEVAYE